ncbi:single stranded DNA-binding domain-containing protein [Phaeacidiphilus oryzae]|uniref:histidine kinase n=1 Tax=Phaeacidiphilus oryzae TaxID=348818 RepID=UPI00056A844B|nr:histidine kinase [Phaeacidiphilus oryzae]
MDLTPHVENLRRELAVAADAGGEEARTLAERLTAPLESAVRLVLLDALAEAADEITRDLAPGSVELRLRGREPGFAVTPPAVPAPGFDYDFDYGPEGAGAAGFRVDLGPGAGHGPGSGASAAQPAPSSQASEGEERGGTARINFRLSEQLKGRIEEAAQRSGLSVNSWLQRAAAAALEEDGAPRRARQLPRGGDRLTGWIR